MEYDVIVVGGGGSGLAAAVSAAENGCSVLLLEKQAELGGTTRIAVGSYTANRTVLQEQAGISDTLEAHAIDAGLFAPTEIEDRNNQELRRWFLEQGSETMNWLLDMGMRFQGPNPEPPNRAPRMHNIIPGAQAYISVLHKKLLSYGGELRTGAPVLQLVKIGERVVGVKALADGQEQEFRARHAVILAAGDYTNSPEMIARFKGSRYADIEGINPDSLGDGHLLAESAGAKLLNMDVTYGPELRFIAPKTKTFQQLLPTQGPLVQLMGNLIRFVPPWLLARLIRQLLVTWQHPENALFDDGAILINQDGLRFCEETVWPDREIATARQTEKIAYILLDSRLIERYSKWPHFISTAPKIAYAYFDDYLRLRHDVAVKRNSLAEIASARGISAEALEKTVEEYNSQSRAAGKPLLEQAPWGLLGPAKAYFTTTEGGVSINKRLEVLDEDGSRIPGLYAVGQNGLGGQILWGHGLHIAWALTSGRLVGKVVASEMRQSSIPAER